MMTTLLVFCVFLDSVPVSSQIVTTAQLYSGIASRDENDMLFEIVFFCLF